MIRYLDMLEALLTPGLTGLSRAFLDAQVSFVVSCQRPDGGFHGRLGDSDAYYTDFALRTLALLRPDHDGVARAAGFMRRWSHPPRNPIHGFDLLNARQLLGRCGQEFAADELAVLEMLHSHLVVGGGLAREPGGGEISAYHTFIGALCYDCMGREMPMAPGAVSAVRACLREAGAGIVGFSELPSQPLPQTNSTAAAVAFLGMHEALREDELAGVATFLSSMQAPDGGMKAHATAEFGDLLSTFTGLLTLAMLEKLDRIDAPNVARFVRFTAAAGGGFRACPADPEADVEYTYYGVGCLSLLRLYAQTRA